MLHFEQMRQINLEFELCTFYQTVHSPPPGNNSLEPKNTRTNKDENKIRIRE